MDGFEDTRDLSWLRLGTAKSTPELDEIAGRAIEKFGYASNMHSVTAHRPDLIKAQDALTRAVNLREESGLSMKERELIALVVSVENRCEPCIFAHASRLRGICGDAVWVGQIEINYRRAALTGRERALADYALAITLAQAEIESGDIDKLRDAGLSDDEILDAAAIASYFNFSNRINSALGIHADEEAFGANR